LRVFYAVLLELINDPLMTKFFTIGHSENSVFFQSDRNRIRWIVQVNGVNILDDRFTIIRLIHSEDHGSVKKFGSKGNKYLPQQCIIGGAFLTFSHFCNGHIERKEHHRRCVQWTHLSRTMKKSWNFIFHRLPNW